MHVIVILVYGKHQNYKFLHDFNFNRLYYITIAANRFGDLKLMDGPGAHASLDIDEEKGCFHSFLYKYCGHNITTNDAKTSKSSKCIPHVAHREFCLQDSALASLLHARLYQFTRRP